MLSVDWSIDCCPTLSEFRYIGDQNRFNPATFIYPIQVRTWISNVICRSLVYVQ